MPSRARAYAKVRTSIIVHGPNAAWRHRSYKQDNEKGQNNLGFNISSLSYFRLDYLPGTIFLISQKLPACPILISYLVKSWISKMVNAPY